MSVYRDPADREIERDPPWRPSLTHTAGFGAVLVGGGIGFANGVRHVPVGVAIALGLVLVVSSVATAIARSGP